MVSRPALRDMLAASGADDAMMQLRRALDALQCRFLGTRSALPARLPSWVSWADMSDRVRSRVGYARKAMRDCGSGGVAIQTRAGDVHDACL